MGEKAEIDLPYMMQLTGKAEAELTEELRGVIFMNPLNDKWGKPATNTFRAM